MRLGESILKQNTYVTLAFRRELSLLTYFIQNTLLVCFPRQGIACPLELRGLWFAFQLVHFHSHVIVLHLSNVAPSINVEYDNDSAAASGNDPTEIMNRHLQVISVWILQGSQHRTGAMGSDGFPLYETLTSHMVLPGNKGIWLTCLGQQLPFIQHLQFARHCAEGCACIILMQRFRLERETES